jgi:hypothetical protein
MKKVFLTLFIVLVLTISLAADKSVTTVMDFQMNSISQGDMKSIVSFLSASLHDTGKYTVIDTAQRDIILKELAFSNSGCSDESCQLEIGKLLSAEYIVTGDIALVGGRYILSARMLETETSATINTAKGIYDDLGNLIDDMPVFAAQLSGDETAVTGIQKKSAPAVAAPEAIPDELLSGKDIAAWSTLGGGVIAAGIGSYLLYAAFNYKSITVDPAFDAYITDSTTVYETSAVDHYNILWSAYETAYGEFSNQLIVSSVIAGAGLVSIGVSIFLFLMDDTQQDSAESTNVAILLLPAPDAATLSCRIRL